MTATQQHGLSAAQVWALHPNADCYISGPMTGYPQGNAPAFDHCASVLRRGVLFTPERVISPAELDRSRGFDIDNWDGIPGSSESETLNIDEVLALDIVIVASPRTGFLVLLDGWEESGGATLEVAVATRLGRSVYKFDPDTETLWPVELSTIIAVCQQSGYTGSKLYGRLA